MSKEQQSTVTFESMDLSPEILKAVRAMGFQEPSTVQARTIPLMMSGTDINAIAPTGTGKTCAFGIPMLEYVQLKDSRIYGGQSISKQISALKRRPQIVIATPGRMLDHMQRGNIRLNAVHTMVLDEADEMLNMGFVKDVTKIIEATPSERQLVLFSATTNQDVLTIAWKYQHDPVEITVEATKEDRPQITQYVIATEPDEKTDRLLYLLDADVYHRIMIFCNTKFMTDKLTRQLCREGYDAQCLHGDIPQAKRNVVMNDFKRGKFPILVSTDVAARGIDVDDVEAVINYDLPNENEYYLHRIGRTGRAHKHGVSFSLVTFRESVRMDEILKYMLTVPTPLKFTDDVLCHEDGTPFFENI